MKTLTAILFGSLLAAQAQSVTVRFDDLDRPPADSYTIGGVYVYVQGGQVSTKAGVGLGAGLDSLISFTAWYEPETGFVMDQSQMWSIFEAPGFIDAITLSPLPDQNIPDVLSDWQIRVTANRNYYPETLGSSTCYLHDEDFNTIFFPVGEDYYWPDNATSFTWGFSIQSLTYQAVPEPPMILLLASGLALFGLVKLRSA